MSPNRREASCTAMYTYIDIYSSRDEAPSKADLQTDFTVDVI